VIKGVGSGPLKVLKIMHKRGKTEMKYKFPSCCDLCWPQIPEDIFRGVGMLQVKSACCQAR